MKKTACHSAKEKEIFIFSLVINGSVVYLWYSTGRSRSTAMIDDGVTVVPPDPIMISDPLGRKGILFSLKTPPPTPSLSCRERVCVNTECGREGGAGGGG